MKTMNFIILTLMIAMCAVLLIGVTIAVSRALGLHQQNITTLSQSSDIIVSYMVNGDIDSIQEGSNVIIVNYQDIDGIAAYARSLVDNGALIYIFAPEVDRAELSRILGIPIDGIQRYNNAVILGINVFRVDHLYVWGNHYGPTVSIDGVVSNGIAGSYEMITPGNDRPFSNANLLSTLLAYDSSFNFLTHPDFVTRAAIRSYEGHLSAIEFFQGVVIH